MKIFYRQALMGLLILSLASCSSSQKNSDDLSMDDSGAAASADAGSDTASSGQDKQNSNDGFNDDDLAQEQKKDSGVEKQSDDLALDDQPEQKAEQKPEQKADDLMAEATPAPTPAPTPEQAAQPAPPVAVTEPAPAPAPEVAPAPAPVQEAAPTSRVAKITGLKFRANETGGTVVIESDAPVAYTTRSNPEMKQLIVEVQNSTLPKKLKRGLNTKDIQGVFGSVDAYQATGAKTSRFVIQLRDGAADPVIQQEGNTILVVGASAAAAAAGDAGNQAAAGGAATGAHAAGDAQAAVDTGEAENSSILSASSLDEFLSNNTKFYGKKISIETNNIEVRDALKFITDETGVNLVIAEEVRGPISLKLRQVPWDQALVTILKAKKLGYNRQGSIIRIAPIGDLKTEEDDAAKLALNRKNLEPLKVRLFPVSYAKVDELERKLKDFMTDKGKVISDVRTNALVVTDSEESLDRVAKLIKSLDVQPPQVLIEGKIVEAKESFVRSVGVNWQANGTDIKIGRSKQGPVNMHPSFQINPLSNSAGTLGFNLNIGTMDVLGDLTSALALSERESKVKVISSPRIVTMSNEKADISQTTEVPVAQVNTNGTTQTTTYQFKPLSLKLDVTPQITNDASVIMKVGVKREFRDASANPNDEKFAVNTREANTKVIVKNGQTAVIGGIYQSDATETEVGVPYLREVPFLGALFRGRGTTKDKAELLIFLTPRIMSQFDAGVGSAGPESNDLGGKDTK